MISKMKFINIVGPKSSFERIVSDYIVDSEICRRSKTQKALL